jgi:hypothetical protein
VTSTKWAPRAVNATEFIQGPISGIVSCFNFWKGDTTGGGADLVFVRVGTAFVGIVALLPVREILIHTPHGRTKHFSVSIVPDSIA